MEYNRNRERCFSQFSGSLKSSTNWKVGLQFDFVAPLSLQWQSPGNDVANNIYGVVHGVVNELLETCGNYEQY